MCRWDKSGVDGRYREQVDCTMGGNSSEGGCGT